MIIPASRSAEILTEPLSAVQSVWDAVESGGDEGLVGATRDNATFATAGNSQAAIQQVVTAADIVVGWAPWQADGVLEVAALPTAQLVAGELLKAVLPNLAEIARKGWAAVKSAVIDAAVDLFEVPVSLISAVPVVAQAAEVAIKLIEAVGGLVELHKASERAKQAEQTVLPASPWPPADTILAEAVIDQCRTGDWTAIWLPLADPADALRDWVRGWQCGLIAPDNPWSGGRRLQPLATHAWLLAETSRGFPISRGGPEGVIEYTLGLGAIPGSPLIHRQLQCNARGTTTVDSGNWLWSTSAAQLQAWSCLWGSGPACFAVDTEQALTAWVRYVGHLLEGLDSGDTCPKAKPEQRRALRRLFVDRILPPHTGSNRPLAELDAPVETVIARMQPNVLLAVRQRQIALAGTTAIPLVDARNCPPGLEDFVRQRQSDFLNSVEVCRVDPTTVPDPMYRASVALAQQKMGAQCFMATDLAAPILGAETFDPNVPPPAPPPLEAIPVVPQPGRGPLGSTSSGGGAAVALLLGGAAALAFFGGLRR